MPTKVKEEKTTEEIAQERVDRIAAKKAGEIKESDIKPLVRVIPTGTNEREIVVSFLVKTNKIKAENITSVVQDVLLASAPEIGAALINVINVEKELIDATRQK